MAFDYPIFLELEGVSVLVVGGGRVALHKATALAQAGAIVTVIAPQFVDGFDEVVDLIEKRKYQHGDVSGFRLIFTATNDPDVNAQVTADANTQGIWVNSADDPANCSFILPAVARRGLVTVAVSTGGASPALAQRLRSNIASSHLTEVVESAAIEIKRQRDEILASGASSESIDWNDRIDSALRTSK